MDAGVTRIGDVLDGGGAGWMSPHVLAERAGVAVWHAAKAIQDLRTVVLGPECARALEAAGYTLAGLVATRRRGSPVEVPLRRDLPQLSWGP